MTVLEMLSEVGQDMELMSKVFMMPRLAESGVEELFAVCRLRAQRNYVLSGHFHDASEIAAARSE